MLLVLLSSGLLSCSIFLADGFEWVVLRVVLEGAQVFLLGHGLLKALLFVEALHIFPLVERKAGLGLAASLNLLLVEAEVVHFRLQRKVALLADEDLARCSMLHAVLSAVESLADQAELRLRVAEDAHYGLANVNSYADLHLLTVLQGN